MALSFEPSLLVISVAFAAAIVSTFLGLYNFLIYPLILSPFAKIPAARWHARILPLYSFYIKYTNTENRAVQKLHAKHGPLVLLGPNEVSVNSSDGLKTIYNGDFPKTEWYFNRFSNFGVDNIFTTRSSREHYQRKKLLTQAYSKSTILAAQAIPQTTANVIFNNLFPILQHSADQKTPVDIHPLNYAYSLDSFTAYQLGEDLGTNFVGDSEARNWLLYHFFAPRPYTVFWEVELPKLTNGLLRMGIRLVPEWCERSRVALEKYFIERYDRAAEVISSSSSLMGLNWPTIFAIAKEKYGRFGSRSFMTDAPTPPLGPTFWQLEGTDGRAEKEQKYDHRLQIASDMYDETVAAIETSGIALTFLHYELARNPAIQAQLRAELASLLPSQAVTGVAELKEIFSNVSLKELDSLPLLEAVITETLRLYPPVGGPQARYTPPAPNTSGHGRNGISCTIDGYALPPGTRVQSYACTLHRNENVYPCPEEWIPRRWIDADEDRLIEMRRWFWAFGSGGRMCLGKNFALVSIKLVVAAIYLRYSVELVGADRNGNDKVLEQDEGFSAGPKGNQLWLQFHELRE
ncbi:cytochrome P450 [Rhypophila decipiens]|uniref:Cytochrome P450 n=1 Tax=Rhypophila decipiens TaxID=261697 RepID=A0AAN6YCN9_9PEZI|nr:cytochrome P450 [Rhypophila decipiens]